MTVAVSDVLWRRQGNEFKLQVSISQFIKATLLYKRNASLESEVRQFKAWMTSEFNQQEFSDFPYYKPHSPFRIDQQVAMLQLRGSLPAVAHGCFGNTVHLYDKKHLTSENTSY